MKYTYIKKPINPPKGDLNSFIYLVGESIREGKVLETALAIPLLIKGIDEDHKKLLGVTSLNRDIVNPYLNNVILSPGYAEDSEIEILEGLKVFLDKIKRYESQDVVDILAASLGIDSLLVSIIGKLINGSYKDQMLAFAAFEILLKTNPKLLIRVLLLLVMSVYILTDFTKENITSHDAQLIIILDLCEMAGIKEINIPGEENPLLKDINLN